MEVIIPENDDNLFPKCDTVLPGTQRTKKGMTEKGTQYKDAITSNKFTQT